MSRVASSESLPQLADSSHRVRRVFFNVLKGALTAGILVFLYKKGMLDLSRVRGVITNAGVVALSLSLLTTTLFAAVVRWHLLLVGQGLELGWAETFRLTMIGNFFNTAIPGAVSGDVVKGYYVVRQQPDGRGKIRAFTTLLLDRVVGLSALICVSFTAMLLNLGSMLENPTLKPLCWLILLLWVGVVAFYAFVLVESRFAKLIHQALHRFPAGDHFVKLFEAMKAYESRKSFVIKGLLISLGIHCILISVLIFLARSLGGFEAVPIDKFFLLVPLGLLVTAIPIAPAGLGTGHGAFYLLFHRVGAEGGADLFTAYVSFQIVISLVGGIFYVRYRGHHK